MSGWREQLKKLNGGTEVTQTTQTAKSRVSVVSVVSVPKNEKIKTHSDRRGGASDETPRALDAMPIQSNPHASHKPSKCSDCQHDKRSSFNAVGGLTGCRVRDDVPLMLPGTRMVPCSLFEAANDG